MTSLWVSTLQTGLTGDALSYLVSDSFGQLSVATAVCFCYQRIATHIALNVDRILQFTNNLAYFCAGNFCFLQTTVFKSLKEVT